MNELEIAPSWTEVAEKRGLDPLGMQQSSVILYQRLLPGISNVSLRVRYYGLYCWLADYYANTVRHTDPEIWRQLIRKAEALYALISERVGNQQGVAGVTWASMVLQQATEDEPISLIDAPYLKQNWGAYGAAYVGQLWATQSFVESEQHTIPLLSEQVGQQLAAAFGEAVNTLDIPIAEILERGEVTLNELDSLASLIPSGISAISNERDIYEQMLFAELENSPLDISRELTLRLLLNLTEQLGRPAQIDDVRWCCFARAISDDQPWELIHALAVQRDQWRIYQVNDLFHVAYEVFLAFVLSHLQAYPSGLPLRNLLDVVVADIESASSGLQSTWQDLQLKFAPEGPFAEKQIVAQLPLTRIRSGICDASNTMKALQLLLMLSHRVEQDEKLFLESTADLPNSLHSLATEYQYIQKQKNESVRAVVRNIISERVIKRHFWVASKKLKVQHDYTFLMESDDGLIRRKRMDGPVFTNPRLGPALSFLHDIHLLDEHGITELGQKRLGGA